MLNQLARQAVFSEIIKLIEPESRVLDLGCGDGALLKALKEQKGIIAQGIDIREEAVLDCLQKGLDVIQGDLTKELAFFPDANFEVVILSRTLQVLTWPDLVLTEICRIGQKAIVAFPNFGNIQIRLSLLFKGKMPKSQSLPFEWYNTPNIHNLTIKDFYLLCRKLKLEILYACFFGKQGRKKIIPLLPNLLAKEALFVIKGKKIKK